MLKRLFEKLNKQRGSATVEAVVAFTGFIFVIFTLLSLVNLCRAQMLVSSAMDNAAKELSQYAYFYKMSGLQKFSEDIGEAAAVGKEDVNSVIGSVDGLYGSMVGAITKGQESYTNIAEATKDMSLEWSDIEAAVGDTQGSGQAIGDAYSGMVEQFEMIGDNPMAYMKSLVAIAGSSALDLAKSRLIAAPLAKMFVQMQFGGKGKADENLQKLGIKGGLGGMNFNRSTIFSSETPEDICLVVYYEVELFQIFDTNVLSFTLCKQSRCKAWLGGDNVQVYVDPTKEASGDGEGGEGEGGEFSGAEDPTSGDVGAENTDPTGESTVPDETTAKTELKNPEKWATGAFANGVHVLTHSSPTYGGATIIATPETLQKDKPTEFYNGFSATEPLDNTAEMIRSKVIYDLEGIGTYLESNDEEEVKRVLVYNIYVPNNISDEDFKKMEDEADSAESMVDFYVNYYKDKKGPFGGGYVAQNVEVVISVCKTDGDYDYGSGG